MACNGANSGINTILQALVNEGEEVVAFEPFFPPYLEHIEYAKGIFKPIPLELNDKNEWVFDP